MENVTLGKMKVVAVAGLLLCATAAFAQNQPPQPPQSVTFAECTTAWGESDASDQCTATASVDTGDQTECQINARCPSRHLAGRTIGCGYLGTPARVELLEYSSDPNQRCLSVPTGSN